MPVGHSDCDATVPYTHLAPPASANEGDAY